MHPDQVPFCVDQQGDEAKLANRFLGGVDLAAGTRLAGIGGEDPHGDLGLQFLELEIEHRFVERFGTFKILHINLYPGEGVGCHGVC